MSAKPSLLKCLIAASLMMITAILVAACNGSIASPTAAQSTTQPTVTATPKPRTLVICLGQEPQSLYLYADSSRSAWDVLEAVYDGPIDTVKYAPQPVILSKLPSLQDGDAKLIPADVKAGDEVVNTTGDLVTLKEGVQVFPSGCTSMDCAQTWDGKTALKMDRLSATFKLLPGLKWSDGQPLTATDSVYSYLLAADPATPVTKNAIDRTASYSAADDTTVVWTGRPGFLSKNYNEFFWTPLPKHTWGNMSAADVLKSDLARTKPLGWGPYMIQEWVPNDHITLVKNPDYFRASESLPKFDVLVYRFLGQQADNNLEALTTGECDIVDQASMKPEQLQAIRQLELDGKAKAVVSQGPEWELLDFNIKPASYDNGYNPDAGDRPDFFSDVRVRQAVAYCLDRSGAVKEYLKDKTTVPLSYLPVDHPLYEKGLPAYAFDVNKGNQLLDEAGWKDADNNPATARVAVNVKNVPAGAKLVLNYAITQAPLRQEMADYFKQSLAQCGIEINITSYNTADFYSAGPDGILFGRKFDLAQFSWSAAKTPPCYLYSSSEIPTAGNGWLGTKYGGVNLTGYSNPEYDTACQAGLSGGLDLSSYQQAHQKVQQILAQDLPSIPLYYVPHIDVTRPDLCGLEVDASARSEFYHLENLDIGACPAN